MPEQNDHVRQKELTLSDLAQIGDMIPGGFFVYRADDTQEMLYVNKNTLRIFACESVDEYKALTGFTFRGLVHPDDFDRIQQSIDEQIADAANEQLDYVEYRIIRKDGSVRWVDDYGHFAQLSGYGDVYYVFISDITDKRTAQEQRLRAEVELEKEKRVSEVKSQFLFHVSHDIRTPMNSIMGFAELVRRHVDEPERVTVFTQNIMDSGKQLLAMIDELLDLSNLEFGHVKMTATPRDLQEQIHSVVKLFYNAAAEKKITLTEDYQLPDGEVMLDSGAFNRIFINLLSNAFKFTPIGGAVSVTAKRTQVSDSRYARYEFTVSDTGIGMSEAFQRHLFEAFEREQSATAFGLNGLGLGLPIVKRLLDMMGGSISVKSQKDEGTVFTVSMPLKLAGVKEIAVPKPDGALTECRSEETRRVLLVEDIEINRMLAETILEEAGFQVDSVPDGCDAVDAIASHSLWHYDLILMDIQMPVMNGYEATRAIRALDRADAKSLPILALSANAMEEDKRKSIESGMNSHIAKPFDVARLIDTINRYIAETDKTPV